MVSKLNILDERITNLRNETKMEISSLRTEMTLSLDSLEKRTLVMKN